MVETAIVNISRIEMIWKVLIAHIDILSTSVVANLRTLSIEALLCIILEIFAHKKVDSKKPVLRSVSANEEDLDCDIDEKWSGLVW